MGMNNVWYPYVEMAADEDLKTQRAELRMNAYATHGGVDKKQFEPYALAASIVGKCHFCVASHYALLKEDGLTTQQLRDIGRIAAVVNAAAQVIARRLMRASASTGAAAEPSKRVERQRDPDQREAGEAARRERLAGRARCRAGTGASATRYCSRPSVASGRRRAPRRRAAAASR